MSDFLSEAVQEEIIPLPEGLNDEEKERYLAMIRTASSDPEGFIRAASDILSRTSGPSARIAKAHKERVLQSIAYSLASASPLLDLPSSTLCLLLNMETNFLRVLVQAAQARSSGRVVIEEVDMPGLLDTAKVAHVMEEGSEDQYESKQMVEQGAPRPMLRARR